MGYFKISNKSSELQELRSNGISWGMSTGIAPLDEIYSIKRGFPLFIAGSPHSAKTEFQMEYMVNTMMFYGWKWCCCYGEGGDVADVFADLCHKLIGKPYRKGDYFSMSESDRTYAEQFFDKHLWLIDDEKDYTLSQFYDEVEAIEKREKIKFDGTCFDPFNDLVDRSNEFAGRDDKWLADELKFIRKVSKKNNRVDVLVTHVGDIKPIVDKDTGKRYTPPALPAEWALGRTWHRRGFVMITTFIPPEWLKDENGIPYGKNVSLITIQKAKPKGTAKLGTCLLNWDWQRNKYFWYENGKATFAYDINEPKNEPKKLNPIKPNIIDFTEPIKNDNTEAPF